MSGFWKGWLRANVQQEPRSALGHLREPMGDGKLDSAEVQFVHWQGMTCYSVTVTVERNGGVKIEHSVSNNAEGFPTVTDTSEVYIEGFDPDDLTDLRPPEEDE